MQWFRQTPFLAVMVFGIGVGLGHAWKSGWIPIEIGMANTGSLADSESADPETFPDLTSTDESSGAESEAADQAEPQQIDFQPTGAAHSQVATTQIGPSDSIQAAPREFPDTDTHGTPVKQPQHPAAIAEPEWAAQPTANKGERVQARGIPARISETARNEKPRRVSEDIRLVANQEPPAIEAGTDAASPLAEELKAIDKQIADEEILPAHRALSKLYWNQKEARAELLPRLAKTSRMIFFEPKPHFVEPYVVQPNDQLRVIASKQQMSWEYLSKLNRTDPKRLQPGQKLKVLKGPFSAIVELSEFSLTIHLQGYFVKRYEVGIGKDGASPVGKFTVLNKIENPQYTGPDGKVVSADDPTNPLGERWLDLGESYGIHGTVEPESIGKAASRGCIRMREKDVIEVYDFLVKGSEVVIRK